MVSEKQLRVIASPHNLAKLVSILPHEPNAMLGLFCL